MTQQISEEEAFRFPRLETERLVLRLLTLQDAAAICEHFSDPAVTQFMDIEPCKRVSEAKEIIGFHLEDSGCRWGIFDKATAKLLGTCGYHCWVRSSESVRQSKAEIGYDLAQAYWGQGIMTEVLESVLAFGFETMDLQRIEADVEFENVRSIGLLEKLGFIQEPERRDSLLTYYRLK